MVNGLLAGQRIFTFTKLYILYLGREGKTAHPYVRLKFCICVVLSFMYLGAVCCPGFGTLLKTPLDSIWLPVIFPKELQLNSHLAYLLVNDLFRPHCFPNSHPILSDFGICKPEKPGQVTELYQSFSV